MEYYNITALNNELTKLENTKNNIKNSLINKGQNITDNRPFSNYVENIDALGTVHQFNTKAEMNTITNLPKGTLGIVYGEYKYSDANTVFTNSIYLPKNLDYTYNEILDLGNNYTLGELEIDENNLYTRVSTYFDGSDMIIVVTVDGVDYNYVWLNGMWTRLDDDKGYKEVSISNSVSYRTYTTYVEEIIQIKEGNNLGGLYQYGNKWNIANTQLNLTADNAFGQPFWGKNGVEAGILDKYKYINNLSNYVNWYGKFDGLYSTLDATNINEVVYASRLNFRNSVNLVNFTNITKVEGSTSSTGEIKCLYMNDSEYIKLNTINLNYGWYDTIYMNNSLFTSNLQNLVQRQGMTNTLYLNNSVCNNLKSLNFYGGPHNFYMQNTNFTNLTDIVVVDYYNMHVFNMYNAQCDNLRNIYISASNMLYDIYLPNSAENLNSLSLYNVSTGARYVDKLTYLNKVFTNVQSITLADCYLPYSTLYINNSINLNYLNLSGSTLRSVWVSNLNVQQLNMTGFINSAKINTITFINSNLDVLGQYSQFSMVGVLNGLTFNNCTLYQYPTLNSNISSLYIHNCRFTSTNVNLSNKYAGRYNLTSINISNSATVYPSNMSNMFKDCSKLTTCVLGINCKDVDNMGSMFDNCRSLGLINIGRISVMSGNESVYTEKMFNNCQNLYGIKGSYQNTEWLFGYVTNASYMFYNCRNIQNFSKQNNGFGVRMLLDKCDNTSHMFDNCISMTSVGVVPSSMAYTLYDDGPLNIDNALNSSYMFANTINLAVGVHSGILYNMNNVLDASYMFYRSKINSINIRDINIKFNNLINASYMFYNTIFSPHTSINILNDALYNCENMQMMFYGSTIGNLFIDNIYFNNPANLNLYGMLGNSRIQTCSLCNLNTIDWKMGADIQGIQATDLHIRDSYLKNMNIYNLCVKNLYINNCILNNINSYSNTIDWTITERCKISNINIVSGDTKSINLFKLCDLNTHYNMKLNELIISDIYGVDNLPTVMSSGSQKYSGGLDYMEISNVDGFNSAIIKNSGYINTLNLCNISKINSVGTIFSNVNIDNLYMSEMRFKSIKSALYRSKFDYICEYFIFK